MRSKSWVILAAGFGAVLLITLSSGLDALRRVRRTYDAVLTIQKARMESYDTLQHIEAALYRSGIFARDFLLDRSELTAPMYRRELLRVRVEMQDALEKWNRMPAPADRALSARLGREIDSYLDSMMPLFDWTPREKLMLSAFFLRKEVLPRRRTVLDLARQIETVTQKTLAARQDEMGAAMRESQRRGKLMLGLAVGLGVLVAGISVWRIAGLENRAGRQHKQTERSEREMRRLSQELVHAQEDERKRISRELHDEVGQTLTALRLEVGNLERIGDHNSGEYHARISDAKSLAEQALRAVRNMAMGLRPSILDDLGLGPALDWQAREFSRRTGIPAEVFREGVARDLPDPHRTCFYRIAQEALTNCARHASAHSVRITLHAAENRASITIQDDGRGMPPDERPADHPSTMGLLGMEERVKELSGRLEIQSQPGKGTLLKATLPLPELDQEAE